MRRFDRSLVFPSAPREPGTGYMLHGRQLDDPYRWLERGSDAGTQAWMAAQEAVTRSVLDAVPGRDWLRAAVARAARHPRLSPPIRTAGGREFVWQAGPDDERLALWMRRAAGAPLEPVLDPNRWPDGEVLAFAAPSPDGTRVAFGKAVGSAGAVIEVLDVDSGRLLPDRPRGTHHESLAWRPDASGFFYAAGAAAGEVPAGQEALWHAVYEHRLGSAAPARRVFADDGAAETWSTVRVSECGRFAILTRWDFVHANAIYLLRLSDGALLPVAPELRAINQVQVIGDSLLIHTDLDAPRGRLCVASLAAPTEWRTLIPEGADTLQTVTGVGGRLYAVYSHAASHQVRIHADDGTHLRDLVLPGVGSVNRNEGEGVVSGISGSWHGDEVWVRFTSYVQPPSIYRYDYAADRLLPYHVPDGGLDPSDYTTEQVWYESRDGTRISMFLTHRRGMPRDGRRPVRLSGYGGFNISVEPGFTAEGAAWLALGGVLAFANVRGGGEYGRAWHEAARKTRRQNAFDDFAAAARWLVAAGYTTPERLAARGNSNGGLLVAVAAMQAPDAFGAVFCRTPTLDMLRYPSLSLGGAALEYGAPADPVEGAYLAAYSPYHNVRSDRAYPAMMFVPALDDRIAPPHDPLKMVARLQAEAADGGPYLLLPLHASGHAGAAAASARVEQLVDELSFYCWALDVSPPDRAALFRAAVADLRAWAERIPPAQRHGEWECDYPRWPALLDAWRAALVDPTALHAPEMVAATLFALARDNESGQMLELLRRAQPEQLRPLAQAALAGGEPDARWQLADALGAGDASVEPLLLRFAGDADEYVRRRALASLARIGSAQTEALALRAWSEGSDAFPWPRMQALWALHRVGSPRLAALLAAAEGSSSELLRDFAARVRVHD